MRAIRIFLCTLLLQLSGVVFAEAVDVNTASAETLAANSYGIGVKKAEAIIDYREKNGPFKSLEDLANVKGIGSKIVERNRSNLQVLPQEK